MDSQPADTLRDLRFEPTLADPSLWLKKSMMSDGYNYIATYVDDIIVVSDDPSQYVTELEQHFVIRNIDNMPHFYLGCNLKTMLSNIKILMGKYIKDILTQ